MPRAHAARTRAEGTAFDLLGLASNACLPCALPFSPTPDLHELLSNDIDHLVVCESRDHTGQAPLQREPQAAAPLPSGRPRAEAQLPSGARAYQAAGRLAAWDLPAVRLVVVSWYLPGCAPGQARESYPTGRCAAAKRAEAPPPRPSEQGRSCDRGAAGRAAEARRAAPLAGDQRCLRYQRARRSTATPRAGATGKPAERLWRKAAGSYQADRDLAARQTGRRTHLAAAAEAPPSSKPRRRPLQRTVSPAAGPGRYDEQ